MTGGVNIQELAEGHFSETGDTFKVVGPEHHLVEPVRQHERLIVREPDGDRFLVHALNLAASTGGVAGPSVHGDQHVFQLLAGCWARAGTFTWVHGRLAVGVVTARGLG
jgi:hypothetical protein